MPLVSASSITKVYQTGGEDVVALDQVSFEINADERVAILGSSGSGKTTLLNIMAGLDRPTSGELRVGGALVSKMARTELAEYRAKSIGVIFQSFQLIGQQSALLNVELPLLLQREPVASRRDRARAALDRVGLGHRLLHRPSELSGGEQQRVAIARALVSKPQVLFADEPTGNLDSTNTDQILDLLLEVSSHESVSIVLITHDQQLAEKFATRKVHVHDGRIQQESTI